MKSRAKIKRRKAQAQNRRRRQQAVYHWYADTNDAETRSNDGRINWDDYKLIELWPIPRPISVEPREGFTIWLRFEDGVEGVIDLSDKADSVIFKGWKDRSFFEGVFINESGCVDWGEPLESTALDYELMYAELLGYGDLRNEYGCDTTFDDTIERVRRERGLIMPHEKPREWLILCDCD